MPVPIVVAGAAVLAAGSGGGYVVRTQSMRSQEPPKEEPEQKPAEDEAQALADLGIMPDADALEGLQEEPAATDRTAGGPVPLPAGRFGGLPSGEVQHFHNFLEEHFGSVEKAFSRLDANHGGSLGRSEMLEKLEKWGYRGDAKELWRHMDPGRKAVISWKDFSDFVGEFRAKSPLGHLAVPGESQGQALTPREQAAWRQEQLHDFIEDHFTSLQAAFKGFDADDSGSITQAELTKKLAELGYRGNTRALWKDLDFDRSGDISWREFANYVGETRNRRAERDREKGRESLRNFLALHFGSAEDAFQHLDDNHSGVISLTEFLAEMNSLGFEGDARLVWRNMDRNGNGSVTREEFIRFIGLLTPRTWERMKRQEQEEGQWRLLEQQSKQRQRHKRQDERRNQEELEHKQQLELERLREQQQQLEEEMARQEEELRRQQELQDMQLKLGAEMAREEEERRQQEAWKLQQRELQKKENEQELERQRELELERLRKQQAELEKQLAQQEGERRRQEALRLQQQELENRQKELNRQRQLELDRLRKQQQELEDELAVQEEEEMRQQALKLQDQKRQELEKKRREQDLEQQRQHQLELEQKQLELDMLRRRQKKMNEQKEQQMKFEEDQAKRLKQQEADSAATQKFLEDNFHSLQRAFRSLDAPKNGSLSRPELLAMLHALGFKGDEGALWSSLDRGGRGRVTCKDLINSVGEGANRAAGVATAGPRPQLLHDFLEANIGALEQAFWRFDGGRSGAVARQDLADELVMLGWTGDVEVLLRLLDRNNKGHITWEDFMKFMGPLKSRDFLGLENTASAGHDKSYGRWGSPSRLADYMEAASAIDRLLDSREDPVHRPLEASLAAVLALRPRLGGDAGDGGSGAKGSEGKKGGGLAPLQSPERLALAARKSARDFGRALASLWMHAPLADGGALEVDGALTPGARCFDLPALTSNEMASVRGLLVHLEWNIRNEPGVAAWELLDVQGAVAQSRAGEGVLEAALSRRRRPGKVLPEGGFHTGAHEVVWPRGGIPPGTRPPVEQIHAFRERLAVRHGSVAGGFRSMDIENRGYVSFDHFHGHLVRLRLATLDAQGSAKAMELFKFLDRDGDDLLSPQDCFEAMELAERIRSSAAAVEEAKAFAEETGVNDTRFIRDLTVTGDLMLRVTTFRRYVAHYYGSFAEGLRSLDPDGNGFIERDVFLQTFISDGYFETMPEALEIFDALDVMHNGKIPVERLAIMEEWGSLGPPQAPRPGSPGLGPPAVGPGGLFAESFPLEGKRSPKMPRSRFSKSPGWRGPWQKPTDQEKQQFFHTLHRDGSWARKDKTGQKKAVRLRMVRWQEMSEQLLKNEADRLKRAPAERAEAVYQTALRTFRDIYENSQKREEEAAKRSKKAEEKAETKKEEAKKEEADAPKIDGDSGGGGSGGGVFANFFGIGGGEAQPSEQPAAEQPASAEGTGGGGSPAAASSAAGSTAGDAASGGGDGGGGEPDEPKPMPKAQPKKLAQLQKGAHLLAGEKAEGGGARARKEARRNRTMQRSPSSRDVSVAPSAVSADAAASSSAAGSPSSTAGSQGPG